MLKSRGNDTESLQRHPALFFFADLFKQLVLIPLATTSGLDEPLHALKAKAG